MNVKQLLEGQFDEPEFQQGTSKKRTLRILRDKVSVLDGEYINKGQRCRRLLDTLRAKGGWEPIRDDPVPEGYVRKDIGRRTFEFKNTPENNTLFDRALTLFNSSNEINSRAYEISVQINELLKAIRLSKISKQKPN